MTNCQNALKLWGEEGIQGKGHPPKQMARCSPSNDFAINISHWWWFGQVVKAIPVQQVAALDPHDGEILP